MLVYRLSGQTTMYGVFNLKTSNLIVITRPLQICNCHHTTALKVFGAENIEPHQQQS